MKYRPRIYYTDAQKALMWDRWQKGDSMHTIARLFDRGHSSVQGVLSKTGGLPLLLLCIGFGAGWVHIDNGWNYTSPPNDGWEYGMFLALVSAAVALPGTGSYSLAEIMARRKQNESTWIVLPKAVAR